MKKFTPMVLAFAVMVTTTVFAQNEYKVLTKVGDISVKQGKASKAVAVGNFLKGDFMLTLTDASYIGLIDEDGKVLELKSEGEYSSTSLNKMVSMKTGSSLTSKYADYLLNNSEENIQNQIKATGAVERQIKSTDASIQIWLPEKSSVLEDRITLTWDDPEHKLFKIEVYNLSEERLASYKVNGHELDLNLNAPMLANKETLLVKVFADGDKNYSNTIALQRLSDTAKKEYLGTLDAMITSEDGALAEYIKASYFLENKLYADAFTAYAKAAKLAPQVESYQAAYKQWGGTTESRM